MRTSVYLFHPLHSCQLGKNERQQAAPSQLHGSLSKAWASSLSYSIRRQYARGDDLYPFPVPFQCLERLFIYIKIQLGGKTHAAHHAQRVVAESNVGVERRTDEAVFHVPHAVERVDQFSETFTVQTYGQCINREIHGGSGRLPTSRLPPPAYVSHGCNSPSGLLRTPPPFP